MNIVALIPARAGSKRIPGKNTKRLGGKPLFMWSIQSAFDSGIFCDVVLASEDEGILAIGSSGARCIKRSRETADDSSPDILWVKEVLSALDYKIDAFAILRPTSPFRSAQMIRDAWAVFKANQPADSLRAITPTPHHPGKMWRVAGARLQPLYPFDNNGVPWHSCPTQTLPPVFVQTASLEIAWTKTVTEQASISGANILPYSVDGWDAFDINTPEDWDRAERHVADLQATAAAQL